MAIRVIDDGPDPSVVKQAICRECGAKLEYVPIDVKKGSHVNYAGETDTWDYIECPKCKNQVELKRR